MASKYDEERRRLGLRVSSEITDASVSPVQVATVGDPNSKYARERAIIFDPVAREQEMAGRAAAVKAREEREREQFFRGAEELGRAHALQKREQREREQFERSARELEKQYRLSQRSTLEKAWDRMLNIGRDIVDQVEAFQGAGANAITFGLHNWLARRQGREELIENQEHLFGGKVGEFVGETLGIGGAYGAASRALRPVTSRLPQLADKTIAPLASRMSATTGASLRMAAQSAGRGAGMAAVGAGAGGLYQTAVEAGEAAFGENDQTFRERLGDIAESVALGAILDPAAEGYLGALGSLLRRSSSTMPSRAERRRALDREIEAFIENLQKQPASPAVHPAERIVLEIGDGAPDPRLLEAAANQRRFERIQQQYEEAVEQQYQLLKQQMEQRGGVRQGGLIRTEDGEVVGRYGRVSNNPRWYQEFYAQHGRKPTNAELRELARQHVNEGYWEDGDFIPPWRPPEIEDIDAELASIRELRESVSSPADRAALDQVEATLENSRAEIMKQLPEGVKARVNTAAVAPPAQPAPAAKPERTISRTQLADSFRKNLGVPIDTGRMGTGPEVQGFYKTHPEVIRTQEQGDYDTLAHEAGHHLTKKFNLKSNPALEEELLRMMDEMGEHNYRDYDRSEWFDEGIGEWFRIYFQNPQRARQLAPKFTAHVETTLPKKVQRGIARVQRDVATWINQGPYWQAVGQIDFTGGGIGKPASFNRWYTRFIDDLHPLKLAEMALTGRVGVGKESLYKMARLSRGIAERAKMAVTRGIFDDEGNKLADGLVQIVRPLEEIGMKEKDFATYVAVKHALDLQKLHGKKIPFSDEQIRSVLDKWDYNPVVKETHRKLIQYNNALLTLLEDAGILSPADVAKLRRKYPHYVPFMRYFDDDGVAGFREGGYGAAKAFANITSPLKRMSEEGSSRALINPIESMVKNTFLVMNAAAKNKVGLQLVNLTRIEGSGAWVEIVPGRKSVREHVIDVFVNGRKQAVKVRDPDLYDAMLSLDYESTNSLIKFLGGVAGVLRAGATLTPEFIVRNMFRDVMSAMTNSVQYGFNPLDFFRGFFHVVTRSEVFDQFINSGGAMGTLMSLDRDANREALKAVFRLSLRDKAMNVVTSPKELAKYLSGYKLVSGTVNLLRKGAEISELSTKVGAFAKVLKKTGDPYEAAYTARDLMDFNRAGSSIRQANRAIAFMNAALQGTDKMVRSFLQNPASFMVRAFTTLVLPAVAIYYWNRFNLSDEERALYENIPQWQKDTFFVIGIPGTGEFVRIPKPFEAGALFATSTERMLRWLEEHDPDAFNQYGQTVLEAFTPPMLFSALTPLLEAITNYSFFRKSPIVPAGEQNYEKVDQYGVYTSELAKEIAQFMASIGLGETNAASPRIIDNTIRGYTAGLGQYAVDIIDEGIKAATGRETVPQPARKPTEQPIARSFFVSTAGGGQVRDDFYREWNRLNKRRNSAIMRAELAAPEGEEIDRDKVEFEGKDLYERMKPYKKEMDKLQREYKQIQKSGSLTSQQKRSKLDELDAKMNALAREALGRRETG